jgi:hypothetical protein
MNVGVTSGTFRVANGALRSDLVNLTSSQANTQLSNAIKVTDVKGFDTMKIVVNFVHCLFLYAISSPYLLCAKS